LSPPPPIAHDEGSRVAEDVTMERASNQHEITFTA
jgi:hypothetical protein